MKRYVILAFILIFGISIISGYMTYTKTNTQNVENSISNPQNIVESVDNSNEIATLEDEQVQEDTNTQDVIQEEFSNNSYSEEKIVEKSQNTISTPPVAEVQEQPIVETKQETSKIENNNNTPQQTKEESYEKQTESSKQEAQKEQTVTLGEEYKTNDTMINTIKNVINSNQSDDMKLYGYNIVVDSSIVETTSQFTYTNQRVIDKIKYKFGTIRIYARDYYNNGEYICTQCYII